ncbi:hypothetical protein GCM10009677_16980 [Sphaerisporangium rubeum]|uniref:Uncharacterized protein n=1 Tax=Sphaerisporangium rubeum TaxID=321317 RepID=A0A7X0IID5_9ACTN|nr:hypothetical protein [Sphaerisporangium rubeum]MBB6475781.1 hypothetical protein [Sphaerisporangium rubeum]
MRVEIAAAIFVGDDHAHGALRLLALFVRGRHVWAVDPRDVPVLDVFLDRQVPCLADSYRDLARLSAVQFGAYAVDDASPPVRVSPDDLDDHVADLELPAVVVVENSGSDGSFLKALFSLFGGRELLKAMDENWLIVGHGGGGDTYRRAEEEHSRFRRLDRVAVVFDSDRMSPGDPVKNAARIEQVRKRVPHVHVLRLREAENYLPNKLLRCARPYRESSTRIDFLKRLSFDQRGHFDMKNGFGPNGVPVTQEALYDGVSPRTIAGLTNGFGRDVIRLFEEDAAKTLTDADFENDVGTGVPDELRGIVAMLRKIV